MPIARSASSDTTDASNASMSTIRDTLTTTPFERFKELTRRIVAVPKAEIAEKERAYQKKRKRAKAKG